MIVGLSPGILSRFQPSPKSAYVSFLYYNFLKYTQIFSQEISIQPGEADDARLVEADRPIIQANGPTVLDVHLRPIGLKRVEENGK